MTVSKTIPRPRLDILEHHYFVYCRGKDRHVTFREWAQSVLGCEDIQDTKHRSIIFTWSSESRFLQATIELPFVNSAFL